MIICCCIKITPNRCLKTATITSFALKSATEQGLEGMGIVYGVLAEADQTGLRICLQDDSLWLAGWF